MAGSHQKPRLKRTTPRPPGRPPSRLATNVSTILRWQARPDDGEHSGRQREHGARPSVSQSEQETSLFASTSRDDGKRLQIWLDRGVSWLIALPRRDRAMTASELITLSSLIDDAKCLELIRRHRWPDGPRCPGCRGGSVARNGHDGTQPHRRRHRCNGCGVRFDDLTGTVPAGHHRPVRAWVLCPYFMGLNPSTRQIAGELGLSEDDARKMAARLREGLAAQVPGATPAGVVGMDGVYVVAGHKGNPAAVQKKAAPGGGVGSGGRRDAAHWRRKGRRSSA